MNRSRDSVLNPKHDHFRGLSYRGGFADPDWLVSISICLIVAGLLVPLARRSDWIGWLAATAACVLVAPFVFLLIVAAYDRMRDAAIRFATFVGRRGSEDCDDNNRGSCG